MWILWFLTYWFSCMCNFIIVVINSMTYALKNIFNSCSSVFLYFLKELKWSMVTAKSLWFGDVFHNLLQWLHSPMGWVSVYCVCVNHSVMSYSLLPHGLYPPPGSSVHEILQARILEWIAIFFSRGSSWSRDRTQVSCIAGKFFTFWSTWEYFPLIITF